jgi:hypothetical protein
MPDPDVEPLTLPPVSLMRGDGWQRCCICFDLHERPFPNLYVDPEGQMWDMCRDCAQESGD